MGKGKRTIAISIPFVSTDKEKVAQQQGIKNGKTLTELKLRFNVREDTIAELETEMEGKEQEIQNLNTWKRTIRNADRGFNFGTR